MKRETTQWTEGNAFLVTVSHEKDGQIEFEKITVFGAFGINASQFQLVVEAALNYAANGIGLIGADVEKIKVLPYPIMLK